MSKTTQWNLFYLQCSMSMTKEHLISGTLMLHVKTDFFSLFRMLDKHYTDLTGGKSSLRIFLPLCGKSWDLKW